MDFLGLRTLTVVGDTVDSVKNNYGVEIDTATLALDDKKTYELLSRGDTLGVFQLDGGGMRTLLKAMEPSHFGDIAAALALYRPGPMAANAHMDYAERSNGRQKLTPIHAGARGGARTDPRRDLPPARLPGAGHGHRAAAGGLQPRPGRPPAPRDGQEEEGDHREGVRGVQGGHARQGLLGGVLPDPVGRDAALLRVRVQQVPHGGLRARLLLDGVPQGQLPGRLHGRPAHVDRRQQGQVGGLPRRVPPHGHQGAPARRQRLRPVVPRRRRRHPVRAGRGAQRRRQRRRVDHQDAPRQGPVHLLHRLPGEGRPALLQQAPHRVADQGGRVRLVRPAPPRAADGARGGGRRDHRPQAPGGHGPVRPLRDGRPARRVRRLAARPPQDHRRRVAAQADARLRAGDAGAVRVRPTRSTAPSASCASTRPGRSPRSSTRRRRRARSSSPG